MNAAGGDSVSVSGTATLASGANGVQPITNLTSLTVNNPNYTMVGAVGSVVVGTGNLVLDHVVSGGTATINTVGNTTTITTSDRAVIDWLRFNIASNETVNFVQPAVHLHRPQPGDGQRAQRDRRASLTPTAGSSSSTRTAYSSRPAPASM